MNTEAFDRDRAGTGTREWSEISENICRGCANDCIYCYAANNTERFGQRIRSEWSRETFTKKVNMHTYRKREGVIMFPTTHDITPFNLEQYLRIAKLILEAGNQLLIVSKPRLDCIEPLINELAPWREQIMLRFTIGTLCVNTSKAWEPHAPPPDERITALIVAHLRGYQTSVSIEPMLGGAIATAAVVARVKPYVSETIWIGKMNEIRRRVAKEHRHLIDEIEQLQSDTEIMTLYRHYKDDPIIRWKESIKKVITKTEGAPE